MRLLILGATGMLGHTLITKMKEYYEVAGTTREPHNYVSLQNLKIYNDVSASDLHTIEHTIRDFQPDVIINCIGVIKHLKESKEHEYSISINALFPHQLARVAEKYSARVIHFSTDCVFSGNKGTPYKEEDFPDANDVYGRTKFLGELAYSHTLTLRTSIIGRELRGNLSLVEWVLAQKGKEVNGYTKALYTGFTTNEMAKIVKMLIEKFPVMHGLYHVSSNSINKFDLISKLNHLFKLDIILKKDQNFACDRRLNSNKFQQDTGYTPPTWDSMLQELKQN